MKHKDGPYFLGGSSFPCHSHDRIFCHEPDGKTLKQKSTQSDEPVSIVSIKSQGSDNRVLILLLQERTVKLV